MYKLRLGRSLDFGNENFYDDLQELEDLGFDSVDFGIAGCWKYGEIETESVACIEEGLERVKISKLFLNGVHLPFGARWDISVPDEELRRKRIGETAELFKRIDPYTPNCYVLHGSVPLDVFYGVVDRKAYCDGLVRSITQLQELTDTPICLETLPRQCLLNTVRETLEILGKLPKTKLCLDVNHLLFDDVEDAVLTFGDVIYTLHISDYDKADERHWLPGKGIINWNRLIGNLQKVGYNGVFNYESEGSAMEVKENFTRLFAEYNANHSSALSISIEKK